MSKTNSTDSRRGTRRATPPSRLPKPVQQDEVRPSVKRAEEKKAAEKAAAKEKAARERAEKRERAATKRAENKQAGEKRAEDKRAAEKAKAEGSATPRSEKETKEERGSFVSRVLASKARKRALIVVAVIVATIVMLYAPARAYYIAWRTQLDLEARYAAILEENEDLYEDLDRLRSREGIEDEARKRGYVIPGETSVVVRGLPEEGLDTGSKANDVVADVPWYLVPLDVIFGYEGI